MRYALPFRRRPAKFLLVLGVTLAVAAACETPGEGGDGLVVGVESARPVPTASTETTAPGEMAVTSGISPRPAPTPASAPLSAATQDEHALPSSPVSASTGSESVFASGDQQGGDGQYAGDASNRGGSIDPWSFISSRSCGDGPLFSAFPMDLENVTNINPLGNLAPPGHTFPTAHMYFGVKSVWGESGEGPFGDGQTFPPKPVYAVAAGQLISISVSTVTTSLSGREVSYDDYGFDIAVCEGLRVRYGHVGPVSDRIMASLADLTGFNCNAYSTGAFALDSCTYAPGLELSAGEQIGFNSGRAAALDVGAFDITTRSNNFLHPELYGEEATGAVCVLDLYPDDQRSAMLKLLGDNNGRRTAEPVCGVLDYTIVGTLQGNWFNDVGSFSQEDLNIAFVYDEVLPGVPVISVGFVPGIQSYAHRFSPRVEGRVNRSFVDVASGAGVFCYQDFRDEFGQSGPSTHLLVEVPEDGRLLVSAESGAECGAGPWQIGAGATEFVR